MKNKMERIKENGDFSLIDHSITHNQLLYRNCVKPGLNKDILISGVKYISLPTSFKEIQIYRVVEIGMEMAKIKKQVDPYNYKNIFIFEENNFKHYVIADSIFFQENNHDFLETSIPSREEAMNLIEEIEELKRKDESIDEKELIKRSKEICEYYLKMSEEKNGEWKILE